MKSEQTSRVKDKYKVRNWKEYNKSLVQRGEISLWLAPSVMRAWREVPKKKVVGEEQYPDCVIQCCLVLGKVYHQPLRQTTGFVRSLLNLLGFGAYQVPDYSTLCRRQGGLPKEVSEATSEGKKLDIAIDSTGLKVYGEGEWKVRRAWRVEAQSVAKDAHWHRYPHPTDTFGQVDKPLCGRREGRR